MSRAGFLGLYTHSQVPRPPILDRHHTLFVFKSREVLGHADQQMHGYGYLTTPIFIRGIKEKALQSTDRRRGCLGSGAQQGDI